jgi:phenylalanyl-tRNA synthetase alpha chain
METRQPPIYIATLGRVYRRDTPSPRSTPNFHQVEALVVDRGITLADLKGTLMHFFRAMFGDDREVRMRTSFFPFTEPSVEFDVTCFLCGGKGCAFCSHTGWFEMGGAGVVDPAVLANVGYDPEEWSGFAWGLGLDRIAAQRHAIPDIRMFWENDLRVLRQF